MLCDGSTTELNLPHTLFMVYFDRVFLNYSIGFELVLLPRQTFPSHRAAGYQTLKQFSGPKEWYLSCSQ